jgi:hypothetical protein
MSLISNNIPNLINGVSQQPPSLRLASQAEEQINGLSDVVTGLKKRPPTEHIATLPSDLGDAKIHTYKRDENEQYTVVVKSTGVQVFDQAGTELDVELASGVDYNYLASASSSDLKVTSVADFNFILNTKEIVALDDEIYPPARPSEALVYLKQANYKKSYEVTITPKASSSTEYTPFSSITSTGGSTDEANLQTSTVIGSLRDSIFATADRQTFSSRTSKGAGFTSSSIRDYTISTGLAAAPLSDIQVRSGSRLLSSSEWSLTGNALRITAGDHVEITESKWAGSYYLSKSVEVFLSASSPVPADNFLTVPATYRNEPMFVVSSLVHDFDIQASDDTGGTTLKVFKETAKNFTDLPNQCVDGFHLAVIGDNNKGEDNFYVEFDGDTGQGVWKETVAAGIQNKLDAATMPHILEKFVSDGTDGRTAGEVYWVFDKAPWADRVAGDDDTNPFPSFVGNTINDIFFHRNRLGVLSDENVIFSEASSFYNFFRTTVRDLLDSSPIDVAVSNDSVSILKSAVPFAEQLLLFADLAQFNLTAGTLLTPKEVSVNRATTYEADLKVRPVSSGNSVFFAQDKGSALGIREYYVSGETELNAADDLTANVPTYIEGNITGMASSSNSDTLLVTTDKDPKCIYVYRWYVSGNEKVQSSWSKWTMEGDIIDISFNGAEVFLLIDYGTEITMEKINLSEDTAVSVTASKHPVLLDRRVKLESASDTVPYTDDNLVYMNADGKYVSSPTTYPTYAGVPYDFSYTFSEQVFKPDPSKPVTIARYQLRNFNIVYSDTSTFDVTVSSTGRDPKTSTFTGNLLGSGSFVLGTANVVPNGTYKVGIQSQASQTEVTLSSSSALPCNFTSAEVEGFVTIRSQRI